MLTRCRLVDDAAGRLAGDRRAQSVEQNQQPATAGVDHAGLAEHVELLGGLLQRDHRGLTGGNDRLRQPRVRRFFDGLTGGFEHRDDRSLDLPAAHRGDDQIDPAVQRLAEQRGVDVVQFAAGLGGRVSGDVGDTTQDLRQDHPGIAARAVAGRRRTAPPPC